MNTHRCTRSWRVFAQGVLALLLSFGIFADVLARPLDAPQGQVDAPPVSGVTLKDTAYPVPTDGVYFVDGQHGNDTHDGKAKDKPYRTLAAAVAAAPAGSTIVLRAGTYRMNTVEVDKPLTIQPYPHEQVWIKGSLEVKGWEADGDDWVVAWDHSLPRASEGRTGCSAVKPLCIIDPAYPQADYLDMVFVDGQPLKQVLSRDAVAPATADTPATFFVDTANKTLYIGAKPANKTVEATVYETGMRVTPSAAGTVVRGLGFAHYAQRGLGVTAPHAVLENNTIAWNAYQGASFNAGPYSATDAVVRGNTVSYNGSTGLTGVGVDRLLMEHNTVAYNNIERFAVTWTAAGAKFNRADRVVIRDNLVEGNCAHAIWLDGGVTNATIVRNTVRRNRIFGIFFEISRGAIIASNLVVDNNSPGIAVANSSDAKIYNNTLVGNPKAVFVKEDNRKPTPAEIEHGATYTTIRTIIRNNILSDASSGWLLDTSKYTCVDTTPMIDELDHNVYHRTSTSETRYIARWAPTATKTATGCSTPSYATLADFQAASGLATNGIELANVATNQLFVDRASGNYRLVAGSPAIGSGVALPEDVAAALGVQAGVPVDRGALHLQGPTAN
jgi:parallel beta-helix repeat protein